MERPKQGICCWERKEHLASAWCVQVQDMSGPYAGNRSASSLELMSFFRVSLALLLQYAAHCWALSGPGCLKLPDYYCLWFMISPASVRVSFFLFPVPVCTRLFLSSPSRVRSGNLNPALAVYSGSQFRACMIQALLTWPCGWSFL